VIGFARSKRFDMRHHVCCRPQEVHDIIAQSVIPKPLPQVAQASVTAHRSRYDALAPRRSLATPAFPG